MKPKIVWKVPAPKGSRLEASRKIVEKILLEKMPDLKRKK